MRMHRVRTRHVLELLRHLGRIVRRARRSARASARCRIVRVRSAATACAIAPDRHLGLHLLDGQDDLLPVVARAQPHVLEEARLEPWKFGTDLEYRPGARPWNVALPSVLVFAAGTAAARVASSSATIEIVASGITAPLGSAAVTTRLADRDGCASARMAAQTSESANTTATRFIS